jgi:hypothetical protein
MEDMSKNQIVVSRLDKILNINIIEPFNPVFLQVEKLRIARMAKFDFINKIDEEDTVNKSSRFLNYGD